jgi:hypothetical protein
MIAEIARHFYRVPCDQFRARDGKVSIGHQRFGPNTAAMGTSAPDDDIGIDPVEIFNRIRRNQSNANVGKPFIKGNQTVHEPTLRKCRQQADTDAPLAAIETASNFNTSPNFGKRLR